MPAVVALAAKAPTRIAGQTRKPPSSTAASAMPLGAQIGLALGLTEANLQPKLGEHEIGKRHRQQGAEIADKASPTRAPPAGNSVQVAPLKGFDWALY